MRRLQIIASSVALFLAPLAFVSAQLISEGGDAGPFEDLMVNILAFANNVLIPVIIGIGFLVFVWGMFKFFILGGANDDEKEKGKSLMIYATLGFVFIFVFWGIVNFVIDTFGLEGGVDQVERPEVPFLPE